MVDLYWEDSAPPPIDVVAKFLAVAERLPGSIAVHCWSERGQSGTLAALYMMKHHGFTAREAIGWLNIVRPGRWPPAPCLHVHSASTDRLGIHSEAVCCAGFEC